MRRHFLLPVIILMLCASSARAQQAQSAAESSPIRFSISSVKSPFALAGDFEGQYSLRDDSIELTISSATVYLRDNSVYKGRRQFSFISVALATTHPSGGWTVVSHALGIPIGETMSPGDRYYAKKMRFTIPKASSVDLTKCWLVVEMAELDLDSDRESKIGYAFAQSDHNIFSPLLAKDAKK